MNNKSIAVELRKTNPKHWISLIKKHHPEIWLEIENYNNRCFKDICTLSSQMVYNWLNGFTSTPLCSITNKPVKFNNHKFCYNKYNGRGVASEETIQKRIQNFTHRHKPTLPSYLTYSHDLHTSEDIKHELQTKISGFDKLTLNHLSNILSWKLPHIKKAIHDLYGLEYQFRWCLKWFLANVSVETVKNSIIGYDGTLKQIETKQLKRKNRLQKLEECKETYSKDETYAILTEFLKTQPKLNCLFNVLIKKDVKLVKSVLEYTKDVQIKKFSEKIFYLLNGNPGKDFKFRSFSKGYAPTKDNKVTKTKAEYDLGCWLDSLNIKHCKHHIDKKEIDIFLPEYNVGIELNGEYWHSNLYVDKNYHINKTHFFNSKGIQILHVWVNTEWNLKQDIVKSVIRSKINSFDKVIYARQCELKSVDVQTTKQFLNENHLQGYVVSSFNYGLFYKNELVSLMTFGKRKITKKAQFELLRFCNKRGYKVIGGASKLFKNACKLNNFPEVITYGNARFYKNDGFYEKLGFKFVKLSPPNYFYYNTSNTSNVLESRVKYCKFRLPKLLSKFDSKKTEKQNMFDNHFVQVYDCGNYVFEYKANS